MKKIILFIILMPIMVFSQNRNITYSKKIIAVDSIIFVNAPTGSLSADSNVMLYNPITKGMSAINISEFNSTSGYWVKSQGSIYPTTITDSIGIGTGAPAEMFEIQGGNLFLDYDDSDNFIRFQRLNESPSRLTDYSIGVKENDVDNTKDVFIISESDDLSETDARIYMTTDSTVFLIGENQYQIIDDQGSDAQVTINGDLLLNSHSSYNSFIGIDEPAGNRTMTGGSNIGWGYLALSDVTDGSECIAIGNNSQENNTEGDRNVSIGIGALKGTSNMTGSSNLAIGYRSLYINSTGDYNVSLGSLTLDANTTGEGNVGLGYGALTDNTTGSYNMAIGGNSLANNIDSDNNVGIGYGSLQNISSGGNNTGIGGNSMTLRNSGSGNTAIGYYAGRSSDNGNYNIFIGLFSGNNYEGSYSTIMGYRSIEDYAGSSKLIAIGDEVGKQLTTIGIDNLLIGNDVASVDLNIGAQNTVLGNNAMTYSDQFDSNVAIGESAMMGNASSTNVNSNVAIGSSALTGIETGDYNVSVGAASASSLDYGSGNVILGYQAGDDLSGGSYNVILGYQTASASGDFSNKLYIDNSNTTTPLIYGEFDNDELTINGDLEVVNGDVTVSNGKIYGSTATHLFVYFGDSTISKSYTTSWQHLTNAYDSMYIHEEVTWLEMSNDTITLTEGGDYDFMVANTFDGDNGETITIRFYNVTQATGIPIGSAITTRGSGNYETVVTLGYADITAGDKIVIQYKGDASGTMVLKNGSINIKKIHN